MWIGIIIFGLFLFLGIVVLHKRGETYDRFHMKEHNAHNAMHHRDTERRRRH